MTSLRIALAALAFGLVALIVWASFNASIAASFTQIFADPWGMVTIADLYLGFIVAGVLFALVERPLAALVWFVGPLVLGNVVLALWLAFKLPRIAVALRSAR